MFTRFRGVERIILEHIASASQCLGMLCGFARQHQWNGSHLELWKRSERNLDALCVAEQNATAIAVPSLESDGEVASVVAYLLGEFDDCQPGTTEKAIALLRHNSLEIRHAAWWGLRVASSRHFEPHLRELLWRTKWDFASAAALDILAFHRLPVQSEIVGLRADEGDEIAWLLAEAGGRMRGAWNAMHLEKFLNHGSKRVREAALRASARCGDSELPSFCREATVNSGTLEAIEFLGVVGSQEDLSCLQGAAKNATDPDAVKAALNGLGRLGFSGGVPFLLEFLWHAEHADSAAGAIERITGLQIPRGASPEPPVGITEEELDLWEPKAPVDAVRAREMWKSDSARFDPTKRYQAGLNVSDNPLGEVFDRLPLGIRYDVYLRERALTPGTPDWELETWPWKQKNPAG